MIVRWDAKVISVVPRKRREWVGGMGAEAQFREIDVGVSISFTDDNGNMFSFGFDESFGLRPGDRVIFRMESTDANAKVQG